MTRSIRIMPKEMQIVCFKRLFPIWNKWREDRIPDFDLHAKMQEVDWESIVSYGQTFHENLGDLRNNYPDFSWSREDNPDFQDKEDQARMEDQIADGTAQHEAMYEEEQNQDPQIPEEEIGIQPTTVYVDGWAVERTISGTTYTKEIEIKIHNVKAKGKQYTSGRIQVTVPRDWLGMNAKISVFVPEIH
jgi:hypothetical protein